MENGEMTFFLHFQDVLEEKALKFRGFIESLFSTSLSDAKDTDITIQNWSMFIQMVKAY